MKDIPFTQFVRPDGRRRPEYISRPDEIADKAFRLIEAGYVFEIEVLMTGQVSMEIFRHNGRDVDESFGFEICNNGPEVPVAVDKMVNEAFLCLHQAKP